MEIKDQLFWRARRYVPTPQSQLISSLDFDIFVAIEVEFSRIPVRKGILRGSFSSPSTNIYIHLHSYLEYKSESFAYRQLKTILHLQKMPLMSLLDAFLSVRIFVSAFIKITTIILDTDHNKKENIVKIR